MFRERAKATLDKCEAIRADEKLPFSKNWVLKGEMYLRIVTVGTFSIWPLRLD